MSAAARRRISDAQKNKVGKTTEEGCANLLTYLASDARLSSVREHDQSSCDTSNSR